MSRALLLGLLPLYCAARAPELKDADDYMIGGCTFVRMVEGNAGLARDIQSAADNARERGRENAAEAGATHSFGSRR